nr:glucose/sorbosone family PQQ-dependent dehydrogenase [Kibdelosporangium sp. MJ126-NF4]CEL13627.1 hypothetical protein [Kibdelosporangium sp. MJ126-NF4]CTQ99313.1 hypothetical protein [Kibdelosporangium sp. MJ126-NF4]
MRTPALVLTMLLVAAPLSATAAESGFRVVTTGMADPYEITVGQDGWIWATEKSGMRVVRIDPRTGEQRVAVKITDAVHTIWSQDGVLGMAMQPASPNVFVAYTYDSDPGPAMTTRTKIVRFTNVDGRLRDPVAVITGMPAGPDHQSARLVYGPNQKLYYTIGDQGANQLDRKCDPNQAQRLPTADEVRDRDWSAYRGKVLRLELDGSIPADNPILDGVRSHVYTYGHRNPQGLVFGANGILYSSEQGPKTDDEVNIISRGANYGWPHVAGYRDDNAYVYGNWSAAPDCHELTYDDLALPPSVPRARESAWNVSFTAPIRTFETVPDSYDFTDDKCAENEQWYICWPTVAPAGLDYVGGSLLMPALKDGTVYRLVLSADGRTVASVQPMWRTVNRYRDIAVSPDGRTIYVATDNSGQTKDINGKPTSALAHPGSILEFRLAS